MKAIWKLLGAVFFVWLFVLMYLSRNLYPPTTATAEAQTLEKLNRALKSIDDFKVENARLIAMAKDLHDKSNKKRRLLKPKEEQIFQPRRDVEHLAKHSESHLPSQRHEELRRKLRNGVIEFWYMLESKSRNGVNIKDKETFLKLLNEQKRTLIDDVDQLADEDNKYQWREKEADDLAAIVRRRINNLQNPKDCAKAKKLVCNLDKGCGFGCHVHHLVYCLITAYNTERTLVIETQNWRYARGGWETVFMPISQTCHEAVGARTRWGSKDSDAKIVKLPIIDSMYPKPDFIPQAVPKDLAPRLLRLHGHPFVWWVGQFTKFLFRPQPDFAQVISEVHKQLDFHGPIVGIHVRRTDKVGSEAAFHSLEEYLKFADEYFLQLELHQQKPLERRRIYLATDDNQLHQEARSKYPSYEFLGDPKFAQSAQMGSRYSFESLKYVVLDMHFLSLCDYLVCTFSSQVCRVSYELMQTRFPDASDRFHSLDDVYYFGGQKGQDVEAVYSHKAYDQGEIDFQPGDKIGIAGNHWDGYSLGTNRRTRQHGLFPSYKTRWYHQIVNMPTNE